MIEDTLLLLATYRKLDSRQESRYSRIAMLAVRGIVFIALVAASAGLGYGAGFIVTNPDIPLDLRLGTVPGLLLTAVMAVTLFTGINQSLRALFLTNDMELLFSAPVRSEAVLSAKLLSRVPLTITGALLMTLPALVAYGIATGLGIGFTLTGLVALLLAPLFGMAAGALLALLLAQVLPAQRLAEYMGAASILFGIFIAIAFQLPRLFVRDSGPDPQTAAALGQAADMLESLPLPPLQAGQGMVDLAQGRVSGLAAMLPYLLLTAGMFAVLLLVANRLYLPGWLRMQAGGLQRGGYEVGVGVLGGRSVETAIAYKDWLMRLRDPRQLASLAGGLIFALFFGFLMGRQGGMVPEDATEVMFLSVLTPGVMLSGALLYVGWATFSQTATAALSLEGRSIYILLAAPLSPQTVMRAKLLSLMAPYGILTAVVMLLGWFFLRFNLAWGVYAWICLLLIGYGMLSLGTALGLIYPRLDWDDPRRMTSSKASWLNFLLSIPYGLLALLMAAAPFFASQFWPQWTIALVLLGLLLLAGLSWGTAWLGGRRVARAWANMEAI